MIDKNIKHEVIIEEGKTTIAGQRAMIVSLKTLVTQQKELERLVGEKWGEVVSRPREKPCRRQHCRFLG